MEIIKKGVILVLLLFLMSCAGRVDNITDSNDVNQEAIFKEDSQDNTAIQQNTDFNDLNIDENEVFFYWEHENFYDFTEEQKRSHCIMDLAGDFQDYCKEVCNPEKTICTILCQPVCILN